jgi:tetratricopeptide (TPR) repeat protein
MRAIAYRRLGRREEYLADVQRALVLDPSDVHMREVMILDASDQSDQPALEDALEKYRALVGPNSFLAEAFEAEDRVATLERLKARERPGGNIRILDAARAYAYLGDHDAAIAKFREFVGTSQSWPRVTYARNHLLQPLLRYPEYQKILATIGCDDVTRDRIQVPTIDLIRAS